MSEESSKQAPPADQDRTDAIGEFFSVGAPLHAVRAGYIKRKADDQLYETILSGRYAHVLAPDRSGKTSLIAATAARLEAIGCKIAVLDLEQIGVRDGGGDPGRWYYNVAYRLLRQLRIRNDLQSWWHDRSILSNRQRLVEFYSEILLQSISERIIVFVRSSASRTCRLQISCWPASVPLITRGRRIRIFRACHSSFSGNATRSA